MSAELTRPGAPMGTRLVAGHTGPVLLDGVIVGQIERQGARWVSRNAVGELGPVRLSRAGALGDLLSDSPSAIVPQASRPSNLLAPRPDGRIEIGGQVLELEAAQELFVRLGEILRVRTREQRAWDQLSAELDAEFADGVPVMGSGAGERPLQCVLRRTSDGAYAARVARFALARLREVKLKDGSRAWRGPIVRVEPDPLFGHTLRPSSRRMSIPAAVVAQVLPSRAITGPAAPEPTGRVVRPMPARDPRSIRRM